MTNLDVREVTTYEKLVQEWEEVDTRLFGQLLGNLKTMRC
jgi:hypothetical protein